MALSRGNMPDRILDLELLYYPATGLVRPDLQH